MTSRELTSRSKALCLPRQRRRQRRRRRRLRRPSARAMQHMGNPDRVPYICARPVVPCPFHPILPILFRALPAIPHGAPLHWLTYLQSSLMLTCTRSAPPSGFVGCFVLSFVFSFGRTFAYLLACLSRRRLSNRCPWRRRTYRSSVGNSRVVQSVHVPPKYSLALFLCLSFPPPWTLTVLFRAESIARRSSSLPSFSHV